MLGRAGLTLAIAAALGAAAGAAAQRLDGQLPVPALPPVALPGTPQLPTLPQLPGPVPLPGGPAAPTLPTVPVSPGAGAIDPVATIGDVVERSLAETTGSVPIDTPEVGRRLFDPTRWLGAATDAAPALVAATNADGGVTLGAAPAIAQADPAASPDRRARLAALLAAAGGRVALDDLGEAARAGEIVLNDPDAATLARFAARGFRVLEQGVIEGLDIGFARIAVPAGATLGDALRTARALSRNVSSDVLHFASGTSLRPDMRLRAPQGAGPRASLTLGMIDGGIGTGVAGRVVQRGFADGAPRAGDHGTSVASLIAGGGGVRGAAPGATLYAGDVYGSDPAGGNALAIARALGWLATSRVEVVTISLVGPANVLLGRAVAAAQARGMVIVAPVGNDGAAATAAYPAAYPGVVAVTGVDARGRVLIEAGRATRPDYAAPGADLLALGADGRARPVRGTSYAAPLVAATIARARARAADWRAAVDAGARDLGAPGVDPVFGRGLVCEDCATRR